MGRTSELREAYIAGAKDGIERVTSEPVGPYFREVWESHAAEAFPASTKTQPRVVLWPANGLFYFVENGHVRMKDGIASKTSTVSALDLDLREDPTGTLAEHPWLAELLMNTTETVELDD